ncbi:YqgE/AlgH family protein [Cytophagaceae bacterium ABcell3]|nr:YqgE/AlgH family protein [Cytophagaceae bacterium ABcell3]
MVSKGHILLSEPYLGDNSFERSVILLCENNEQGAFGFILNKPTILTLEAVLAGVDDFDEMLYMGGPVGQDSLHFIYRNNFPLEGSVEVMDNLYWGGDYEQLKYLINTKQLNTADIRFFLGYSGWGEGQLDEELEENAWIVAEANSGDIFDTTPGDMWRFMLQKKGGKYKMMSNYPIDPRLN